MVIGHFMQFSVVNDLSLYFSIMQPMFSFTKRTKQTMMGKSFWDNSVCSNNIMLTQQLKQAKNMQYSNMFQNICNIFTNKYYYLLQTCFLSQLKINLFNPPQDTTIYIVLCNDLKYVINRYMIQYTSNKFKHKCHVHNFGYSHNKKNPFKMTSKSWLDKPYP